MRARADRFLPRRGARAFVACIGLGAIACVTALEPAPSPATPAAHAELGGRIGELMRNLSTLADERLPQAMDVSAVEQQRTREIVPLALAMARSAGAIAESAPQLQLDAEEQARFQSLADRLGEQSRELAAAARRDPPGDLEARVQAVRETCNSCHVRFRIPGAPGEG
jgi:cytochrome c556